ncbi:MAG: DUF1573 domain-containing protein [Planctomycetes bacterium]|nr:DUF1573 domain-containing protein [Planctomycetota bacterium]
MQNLRFRPWSRPGTGPLVGRLMIGVQSSARRLALAALLLTYLSGTTPAQEWARKMFPVTSHNFGTVAKGSKTEYRFVLRNLYEEDLHVVGVRTSCGCTSPSITARDLKTHETAEVVATFNTRTFLGQHGATLTVTFDRPFSAEVQLRVAGNIRGDVTFDPPFVDLGTVDLGKGAERQVRVTHIGSTPWDIKDVRSANANFEVSLSSAARSGSKTVYDLTTRLKPTAPAGYIKGQLILVTNDPRATQIPMDVEGRVVAEVTVSPQLLALGTVPAGDTVTKNIVIRATREFKITGVFCSDGCLTCEPKTTAARVHILPVTFQAGEAAGKVERELRIATDLGEGAVPVVTVQAEIEQAGGGAATPPADRAASLQPAR